MLANAAHFLHRSRIGDDELYTFAPATQTHASYAPLCFMGMPIEKINTTSYPQSSLNLINIFVYLPFIRRLGLSINVVFF